MSTINNLYVKYAYKYTYTVFINRNNLYTIYVCKIFKIDYHINILLTSRHKKKKILIT